MSEYRRRRELAREELRAWSKRWAKSAPDSVTLTREDLRSLLEGESARLGAEEHAPIKAAREAARRGDAG